MRIGEVARKSGVSVRSLRYYEEHELLSSQRSPSGQRTYDDAAVARVALIQQLYAAGISSAGIQTLLPCIARGESSPEAIVELRQQRAQLLDRIKQLEETVAKLDDVIDTAVYPRDDCTLVGAASS